MHGSVLLYGFGRNSLGRFSVAAVYNESLHILRCEKKYMLTKFAARRGRRCLTDQVGGVAGAVGASTTSGSSGTTATPYAGKCIAKAKDITNEIIYLPVVVYKYFHIGTGLKDQWSSGLQTSVMPTTRQRSVPSIYSSYVSALGGHLCCCCMFTWPFHSSLSRG